MDVEGEVARHYAQSELTRTVLEALRTAGKDLDALDAAGRERIRLLDRATGAERAVTEIAPRE